MTIKIYPYFFHEKFDYPNFHSSIIIKHLNSGEYDYMDKQTNDLLNNPYIEITLGMIALLYGTTIREIMKTGSKKYSLLHSIAIYCLFDICEEPYETIATLFKDYQPDDIEQTISNLLKKMSTDHHLHTQVRLVHGLIKDKVILKEFEVPPHLH